MENLEYLQHMESWMKNSADEWIAQHPYSLWHLLQNLEYVISLLNEMRDTPGNDADYVQEVLNLVEEKYNTVCDIYEQMPKK